MHFSYVHSSSALLYIDQLSQNSTLSKVKTLLYIVSALTVLLQ